jgi:uncharacterized RmlC-like cupin family protein
MYEGEASREPPPARAPSARPSRRSHPAGEAKAHLHRGIESAAYVIEGEIEMYFGKKLEARLLAKAGEYVYIPPDMPHLVHNPSMGFSRALVAHTSANDQDGIVLLPALDDLVT